MMGRALCSRGPHRGISIIPGFILIASLVELMQQATAQLYFNPKTVSVKENANVTLTPLGFTMMMHHFKWFKGAGTDEKDMIINSLRYFMEPDGLKFTGHESVESNGNLMISSVLRNHTGDYTLEVELYGIPDQQATVHLSVTGGVAPHAPLIVMMTLILLSISTFL